MTSYIYEVTMEGPESIQAGFQRCLNEHISEMLGLKYFTSANLIHLGSAGPNRFQIRVFYSLQSLNDLNLYIKEAAADMRDKLPSEYREQIKYRRYHYDACALKNM